jgi:hypothetical protein
MPFSSQGAVGSLTYVTLFDVSGTLIKPRASHEGTGYISIVSEVL